MIDSSVTDDSKFLPLEAAGVPQWVWKKAEIEINETEEIRRESLKKLKKNLQEDKDLRVCLDDKFLLRFLRARKFDWRRALALIKGYYSHRVKYPYIYEDYTAESLRHVAETNFLAYLSRRTSSGSPIWVSLFGRWDPDEYPFYEVQKYGLMALEEISQSTITQICGVTNVIDLEGFGWKHISHITIRDIQSFVSGIQDSFPLRQKAVHVVNNPGIFSMLFFLIRPLLSEKVKKRIFFHGSDMKSLHEHIPPSILPAELGGDLGPLQSEEFFKLMLRDSKRFRMIQNFGYICR